MAMPIFAEWLSSSSIAVVAVPRIIIFEIFIFKISIFYILSEADHDSAFRQFPYDFGDGLRRQPLDKPPIIVRNRKLVTTNTNTFAALSYNKIID
jgi:hypothetical protein